MREVSDAFLLNMGEVSAALVGLFLVGIFFYVETGFRRSSRAHIVEPYFQASTRIVLILFAITIGLSMSLVVLELVWSRVLFVTLSVLLVASNVDTAIRMRGVARDAGSPALLANEVAGTIGVVALVVTPWALGGLEPTREDLTWAILLSFLIGFLSICALVLSTFDVGRAEAGDHTAVRRLRRRRRLRIRPRGDKET